MAQANTSETSESPKMPRGVALMVRSILGIDPEELWKQLEQSISMFRSFCQHFDLRMVAVEKQLAAMREEIASLKSQLGETDDTE